MLDMAEIKAYNSLELRCLFSLFLRQALQGKHKTDCFNDIDFKC